MGKKVKKGVVVVAVIIGAALIWQFGVRPRMARYQAWQGVIKETYRLRDPKKDTYEPHRPEHLFYDHYWFVISEDGALRKVQMPYKLWGQASPGQRVTKQSGERYPVLLPMTDEDRQKALEAGYIEEEKPSTEDQSDPPGMAFLAENAKKDGVTVLPSGLQYKVLVQGDGPSPAATDKVKVHYRGTFIDGREFDSSYKRGTPAVFALNQVIKGWTEAVQLMNVGAKWQICVPSELAYGRNAPPQIGPNKVLVFEIELLEVLTTESPTQPE